MKSSDECRFCGIIAGEFNYTDIDQPFACIDDYLAVASIGAMIEGWSLIIPREHQLSMKGFYDRSKFSDFLNSVIPSIVNRYGSLIAFEHGANKKGSITSCGTDHAHLHLVPMNESLLPGLQTSDLMWVKCHTSDISSIVKDSEYLFYTDIGYKNEWQDPLGYLHVLNRPISQYFRQLIAERIGCFSEFDYKKYPNLHRAKQTRRVLSGSLHSY